ncbi:MAG: MBL fold metallo-hydrolase RNA specificity domain-containing protein [Anaerolineae bacterium]
MISLQFLGAAREVTGSMHLLTVGGHRLLLDCGLIQGPRKTSFERNRAFPVVARDIDAVVLSHAHIDHSGRLPLLVKGGYRGHIFCTSATRDLCAYMLPDAGHLQELDVSYRNKRRAAQGRPVMDPLYTLEDAIAVMPQLRTVELGQNFSPIPGVTVHFINAGHILGAASVILDIEDEGRQVRLGFSGDIGRWSQPILRDPEIPADLDYLIMEGTYGNRSHEGTGEAREVLRQTVEDVWRQRGRLIIPAFAVGRTQEIVYRLNELSETGQLPPIRCYVDSPLAVNATEVFRLHPECYDQQMLMALAKDPDHDPLSFKGLRYVREVETSKLLNTTEEPVVIISASGMCEGGRVLHHLKHSLGDVRNTVMFVGFQAEGTLGRAIADGQAQVRIYGEEIRVRATVKVVSGYSAHADRAELLRWGSTAAQQSKLQRSFLVHGEPEPLFALAAALREEGLQHVEIPEPGQVFPL